MPTARKRATVADLLAESREFMLDRLGLSGLTPDDLHVEPLALSIHKAFAFRIHYPEGSAVAYRDRIDREPNKYHQPKGSGCAAYAVSTEALHQWQQHRGVKLIVEGELKGACGAKYLPHPCIGIGGVDNGAPGGELLPEIAEGVRPGDVIVLVPDGDARVKAGVLSGMLRLAVRLVALGADVRILALPEGEDGEKVGLDDWITGMLAAGCDRDALAAAFSALPEVPIAAVEVAKVNAEFALMDNAGAVSIWRTIPDCEHRHAAYRAADFKLAMANRRVPIPTDKGVKMAALADLWLASPERRRLHGVGYWPIGAEPEGYLNLWHGFAVEPKRGQWPTLQKFIRDIVCDGDHVAFDYLVKLLAWKVQHPHRPPEVMVMMRSTVEGVGKGTFARIVQAMFGPTYRLVQDAKHVIGDFNDTLVGALVIFLDESYFAGNPEHTKRLMSAITEPALSINPKGKPHLSLTNSIFWLAATNNEQALRAARTSRRYLMLDIKRTDMLDAAYARRVHAAIEGAEVRALLGYLLALDLTDWHPRHHVPQTEALIVQRKLSLAGPAAWWADVMESGEFPTSALHGDGLDSATVRKLADVWRDGGSLQVALDRLHLVYCASPEAQRSRDGPPRLNLFGQAMKELAPLDKKATGKGATFARYWRLPSLEQCRAHFERWLRGDLDKSGSITKKLRA